MKKRKSTKAYKAKFGYHCMNCGEPANHVHHLIPLSEGGPDHPDYWVLLCQKCHKAKGLHSDPDRFFTELATKKFYAESLVEIPKIEIPPEISIIGPQQKINLIQSRLQIKAKVSPEAKIEASTRIQINNQRLKFPILGFSNMRELRQEFKYLIRNDNWTFSDIFNLLSSEVRKKGG